MHHLPLLAAGLLCLCPHVSAQETEEASPPKWLRLITRDADFALGMGALLGAEPVELELSGAERAQLEVGIEGEAVLSELPAGGHQQAWAEIFLRGVEILPAFLEEHEEEVARVGLQADFVMRQAGYPAGYGKELFGQALSVLKAFSGAYVRIEGDPSDPAGGLTVFVDLVPQPETELNDWVRALAPNFHGAPAAPPMQDAVASMRLSLSKDSLFLLLAPFSDLACRRGAKTEEEVERNREFFEAGLQVFDGTSAAGFDGSRFVTYTGLSDAEAAASMLADEQYRDWIRDTSGSAPGVDVEVRGGALEHRGVSLTETTIHSDALGPLAAEGKMVSYRGVAKDYEVTVAGAGLEEAAVKEELDRVLDAGPKRSELPDNGIFVLDLDLNRLMDMLPVGRGLLLPPPEAMPGRARLLLHKIGVTLKLRLELR